jgi:uncharacterized RDD family membrane protein YckC
MASLVSGQAIVGWVILPAVLLSLAYPAILTRLSMGLVSPYAKADVRRRLYASLLDAFVVLSVGFAYIRTGAAPYLALATGYTLFRDAINGQSPGKFICGLIVLNIESGRPAAWRDSARRNLLFLLPGANIAAIFLETRTLMHDPQGQRLGDRFAQTQVVEGAGAADLVKTLQDWLLTFTEPVGRSPGRRDRSPVRDRAA